MTNEKKILDEEIKKTLEHINLEEVLSNPKRYFNMPRKIFKEIYPRMIYSKSNIKIDPITSEVWVNTNILNSDYYMSPAGIYFPEKKSGIIVVAFDNHVQLELEQCFTSEQNYITIFEYGDLLVKKSIELAIPNKTELSKFVEYFYDISKNAIETYETRLAKYKVNK